MEIVQKQWTLSIEQGYREWKQAERLIRNADEQTMEAINSELQNRRIKLSDSRDILRWGYTPKGSFSTKEAYKIMCNDPIPLDPLWSRIWTTGIWPKVSLFLWLFGHQRILTWDNLWKRNFHGPSKCPNCNTQEETLQHLLDSCSLANQLWEKASFHCQKRCRVSEDIIKSIRNWNQNPYKSELLNQLWRIIPGLLLWTIWKEWNKCIFKDQSTPLDIIWSNFCLNLTETLAL